MRNICNSILQNVVMNIFDNVSDKIATNLAADTCKYLQQITTPLHQIVVRQCHEKYDITFVKCFKTPLTNICNNVTNFETMLQQCVFK